MVKLSNDRVSKILDRASLGGSFRKMGKDIKETPSTIWNVLKDFPLWKHSHDTGEAPTEE